MTIMSINHIHTWIGVANLLSCNLKTYDVYKKIPVIAIDKSFKDINTLDDILSHITKLSNDLDSPTDCYFDVDKETGTFYRDQQDCVVWRVDKKTGFIMVREAIVANSIPEFLTRINLENIIWHHKYNNRPITQTAQKYWNDLKALNK